MKPLEGLRIIAVEQFAAGPYGTMLLAGLGADVIKIENPATNGDPARYTGSDRLGPFDTQYFQGWNLNKRSAAIDLKSKEGRRDFERLVQTADVVLNNLRGDQPAKLKLDYANLQTIKSSIVCVHISAYGRDNERASWPGYDYLMQAEAGLMSLTGEPDGPPCRFGSSVVDCMTGCTAMVGLLSAVLSARRSGTGCDVDVCLFDVAIHQLGYAGTWYLNDGKITNRQARSAHFSVAPVQTFRTADGWIFIMCMDEKFWRAMANALSRTDLLDDSRFGSNAARVANLDALNDELDGEFEKHGTEHWLTLLTGLLPIGPVYDVAQALANPFVERIGMVQKTPHPNRPEFRVLANPIKINGKRGGYTVCPPFGADTEALLNDCAKTDKG